MNAGTWRDDARCRTLPDADALFFPEGTGAKQATLTAARFCRSCPVVSHCLASELAVMHRAGSTATAGVFGGTTAAQRASILRSHPDYARSTS